MLGEKVQRLRKERAMSQEELAAELGISRQAVSKWELGESTPDTENIVQLSRILGVSADYLLGIDGAQTASAPVQGDSPPAKSSRRLVGLVLLNAGLVALVALLIINPVLALVIGVPLVLCGIISLTVKKNTGLWCGWGVYALFYGFYAVVTGGGPLWIFRGFAKNAALLLLLPLLALIIITLWRVRRARKPKL